MNRNLNYPRRKFQEYADSGEIQSINIGSTIDEKLAVIKEELNADIVISLDKMYDLKNIRIGSICILKVKQNTDTRIFMNISGLNYNATDWKDITVTSSITSSITFLALTDTPRTIVDKQFLVGNKSTNSIEFSSTIQSGTF